MIASVLGLVLYHPATSGAVFLTTYCAGVVGAQGAKRPGRVNQQLGWAAVWIVVGILALWFGTLDGASMGPPSPLALMCRLGAIALVLALCGVTTARGRHEAARRAAR